MPSKHKKNKKPNNKGNKRGSKKMDVFRQPFDGNHPTVVLKSRSLIGVQMTGGVFYEQFNLIPQLANASADIL
jgi:hypothetical protein